MSIKLHFSAHADQQDLLEFIQATSGRGRNSLHILCVSWVSGTTHPGEPRMLDNRKLVGALVAATLLPFTGCSLLKVDFATLVGMAPPSAKPILASYDARWKKYEECADRVWKPYGKQIGDASWTVRHSDGSSSTVQSPKAQKIREQGDAAIDKACGSQASLDKEKETTRAKLLVEVEKERAKLLTQAKPLKL